MFNVSKYTYILSLDQRDASGISQGQLLHSQEPLFSPQPVKHSIGRMISQEHQHWVKTTNGRKIRGPTF